MIRLHDLTVSVGDGEPAVLLDRLGLHIPEGQCVLVTGGSGAGKSSLIGVLNGLIPHVHPARIEGSVSVNGISPAEVELADAGIVSATVFQNPRTQFFATDVLSEVAFGAANHGVPREVILGRIAAAARQLGLEHLLDRRMSELSGGERQRVALASALVLRPAVYLLDEPTANLDENSTAAVAEAVGVLRKEGATILVVEHRVHHLRRVVDRVVELREGRIAGDRPAEAFWAMSDKDRREARLRSLAAPQVPSIPSALERRGTPGEGLELRDLTASRDGRRLWTVPYAQMPRGTVTCVTGPNGAGKSTLARVLLGLHRARGSVSVDGVELSRVARRRRCAAVMQDVNRQLVGFSVAEELAVGRWRPEPDDVKQILGDLGLAGLEERHPLSLSGGQRQRLAVATASVGGEGGRGANVIVFDEPTSGLDLRSMESMAAVIRRCADRGAILVVITHDRELIELVGDLELKIPPVA